MSSAEDEQMNKISCSSLLMISFKVRYCPGVKAYASFKSSGTWKETETVSLVSYDFFYFKRVEFGILI